MSIKKQPIPQRFQKCGIFVEGANLDKEAVIATSEAINSILNSPHNDQKTKRLALQILSHGLKVEAAHDMSFSGGYFDMRDTGDIDPEDVQINGTIET